MRFDVDVEGEDNANVSGSRGGNEIRGAVDDTVAGRFEAGGRSGETEELKSCGNE